MRPPSSTARHGTSPTPGATPGATPGGPARSAGRGSHTFPRCWHQSGMHVIFTTQGQNEIKGAVARHHCLAWRSVAWSRGGAAPSGPSALPWEAPQRPQPKVNQCIHLVNTADCHHHTEHDTLNGHVPRRPAWEPRAGGQQATTASATVAPRSRLLLNIRQWQPR